MNTFFQKLHVLILIFVISAVFANSFFFPFYGPQQAQAAGWYNNSWNARKVITFNHTKVSGNQTNFPALIELPSDANLAARAQSSGNDILFTASDGTTKLSHQIELYTSSTGRLIAWVKIPLLSSTTDTQIYMYFGNPSAASQQTRTAVWDSNYMAVWHLNDTGGSGLNSYLDSTANSNNGQGGGGTSGREPARIAGRIGYAQAFTPEQDYIEVQNLLSYNNDVTVSSWFRGGSQTANFWNYFVYSDAPQSIEFGTFGNASEMKDNVRNKTAVGANFNDNTWHYAVGVVSNNQILLYIDGSLEATGSYTSGQTNSNLYFALGGNGADKGWAGDLEEIRLSRVARSAGWIATEYNNQFSVGSFLTVGTLESVVPTPTAIPTSTPIPTPTPVPFGSIVNLNFGISNLYPWMQVNCGSVRVDNGVSSRIPQSAPNPNFVTTNSSCGSPGVIISGDSPYSFGRGQASNDNWIVGGSLFPEEYVSRSAASISTSYDNMLAKAQVGNTPPTSLATVCNISNCVLPLNLPSGVYTSLGDVNLQAYTVQAGRDYIFLVRGNLTLNGSFLVPQGSGSTTVFSVRGNITVDESVGTAANATQNSLEGIYSTDRSFIAASTGSCPDLRLNIGGAVIVNAGVTGGTFLNDRDLCGSDSQYPTIFISQRLDMILNAAPFITKRTTTSSEAAP